jgi:dienelactone hydrolase
MRYAVSVLLLLFWAAPAHAGLQTKSVEYTHAGQVLEGFLAYDDAVQGRRPAVLVVHEWWGLNDYIKKRTEQLAGLGYIAFAADMYGKGKRAKTAQEAGSLANPYLSDRRLLRERAGAGLQILENHDLTQKGKIAAIGYCFGGTTVLELGMSGAPVAGIVSFHGSLNFPNPEDFKNIKGKVLVLTGAEDPFVPPDKGAAFWQGMRTAGADWQMNLYSGAVHSFTNPESGNDKSKGVAYNRQADRRSWEEMKLFFGEIFT